MSDAELEECRGGVSGRQMQDMIRELLALRELERAVRTCTPRIVGYLLSEDDLADLDALGPVRE